MIARVTWGKVKPGKWDEYSRLWNDYAASVADVPGSRGRVLLRDGMDKDSGYSISFWDSEDAFDAQPAMADRTAPIQDCFVGQYVTSITEVTGSTLPFKT